MNSIDRDSRTRTVSSRKKSLETKLAILFQGVQDHVGSSPVRRFASVSMDFHVSGGSRKYLNVAERRRFIRAAWLAPPTIRTFCLVLASTGGRISEVLAVTAISVDLETGVLILKTLKRRSNSVFREVPLPPAVLDELQRVFRLHECHRNPTCSTRRLWRWSRQTAWRYVKSVMATAEIRGYAATPRGLRHAFGVAAFQANVPAHIVQRWLGHASLRTTGIYGDVIGPEERAFAARTWEGRTERFLAVWSTVCAKLRRSLNWHR